MFCRIIFALILWASCAGAVNGQAQDPVATQQAQAAKAEAIVEDALNRGTPRGSAVGFVEACAQPDFQKASNYLDLEDLPESVAELGGAELARQLHHVMSRAVWLDDYTVSDRPEGARGDGLPENRDQLVVIRTEEGEEFPIWLQRVPREDGEPIWKVSNRSVALIPELYDRFSYPPAIERIRGWFPDDVMFLGIEAFKWFIMLALVVLSWPLLWGAGALLSRVFSSPGSEIFPLVQKFFTGPLVMIGLLLVAGFAIERLGAGAYAQTIMEAHTLPTIAVVWTSWSLANLYRSTRQARLESAGRPGAAKLLRPITGLVKIVVLLFGLLFWLNNIGVNITTVLAGLGVGGLAVALALQKPLEDMMGALTIFSQAPMRVGDLVRYGNVVGTVEDIGLRTTRVRTVDNTVVSIPNARIAHVEVENLTYRTKIRFQPTLRLRYDTTREQVRQVRDDIREMLSSDERVYDDPVRVRFTDFDLDAILVKVHCFLRTTDFNESLEIGEELNLRIMEIVEAAGAQFALPGRAIYPEGPAQPTSP